MITSEFAEPLNFHQQIVVPGSVIETWCSKHMVRTRHLYTGHKLICLECHPESDPEKEGNDV
jgi:hypothetical protein